MKLKNKRIRKRSPNHEIRNHRTEVTTRIVRAALDQLKFRDPENEKIIQLKLDQWVRGANLTTGRYGHGAVACQGSAFIIGGTNGSDDLDSLEKYDHFNNIWERIHQTSIHVIILDQSKSFCVGQKSHGES